MEEHQQIILFVSLLSKLQKLHLERVITGYFPTQYCGGVIFGNFFSSDVQTG